SSTTPPTTPSASTSASPRSAARRVTGAPRHPTKSFGHDEPSSRRNASAGASWDQEPPGGVMRALVDIQESVHVDATPDTVWQLVTDVRRHPEYAGPKSITKVIDFDDTLHVGARWVAHERFGPQKFDAPSEVTTYDPGHEFGWVSYPPMKEENRGDGGKVL